MNQRREVQARLDLYQDLSGILAAMSSFALAELHKVNQREQAQQRLMQALGEALDDLASIWPQSVDNRNDIGLLLGSSRGFCGSFNEDVARQWHQPANAPGKLILLGERLHGLFDDQSADIIRLPGAGGSLDAANSIDSILTAVNELRGDGEFGLLACYRDESGPKCLRLWPIQPQLTRRPKPLPFSYASPERLAAQVAEQYLYHSLLALLLSSIRVENHLRLLQMETALQHLERNSEELRRLNNRLRQEEIVEEIELMVGRR